MVAKFFRLSVLVSVCLFLAALATLLGGCGGSGCCVGVGGARGYVYQPVGGGPALVSASPTPPVGYVPVPAGTAVQIQGYPDLLTHTGANGYYFIPQIPPGLQVLEIDAPSGKFRLEIPIIINRITDGGGHSEGGG